MVKSSPSSSELQQPPLGRARGEAPSPLDIYVGSRLRQLRALAGLSQEKLGEALGLTFQQIQKYERGQNRVAASRLFDMARTLGVNVGYFFEGFFDSSYAEPANSFAAGMADSAGQDGYNAGGNSDLLARKETMDLIRAYYQITDEDVRKRMLDLIRSMGANVNNSPNTSG